MDNVSGGTVTEFEQLLKAFQKNPNFGNKPATHIPGGNVLAAKYIESFMSNEMGIDANISLGVGGTGLFSKYNTYRDLKTGKSLSHNEVLNRAQQIAN